MNTTIVLIAYAIYLPVALLMTYYVSKTLFKHSLVFMHEIFANRIEIASATNRLYELGFYLINMGFALFVLRINRYLDTYQELVEVLSQKIGGFSIYLGVMLMVNLFLFFKEKNRMKMQRIFEA
jgi:hypothetical protein